MLRCMQSSSSSTTTNQNQNLNGNDVVGMDMSVLERQRALFQRLYHHDDQINSPLMPPMQNNDVDFLHQFTNQTTTFHNNMIMMINDENNAMLGMENNNSKMDHQYRNDNNNLQNNLAAFGGGESFGFASSSSEVLNSSFEVDHGVSLARKAENKSSTRKRKAEIDVEDGCKDKGNDGEAGEAESEITVIKSERENSNEHSKASEVKKPDYIHVRARRGQATDSHSLAERARREKISKKMKYLQELVPGCNKLTGKAGMLDEIINYVQSLQKQVEFLSMKLASLNPRLDFNVDNFFAKEIPAYIASFPSAIAAPIDVVKAAYAQLNPLQQVVTSSGVDIVNNTNNNNGAQIIPQRREASNISIPEVYLPQVQQLPTWDNDWQNPYNNLNFH